MDPVDAFRLERKAEKAAGGKVKLIAIVLAVVLVLVGGWMIMTSGGSSQQPIVAQDGKLTDQQSREVKSRVEKLIKTPQEEPVMAVVTQADALIKEQPFYQGVENGDILLIYPQSGKAILYSAKQDMLLNVGPVQVGDQKKTSASPQTNTSVQVPTSNTNSNPTVNE
jgi:hypothetical protein